MTPLFFEYGDVKAAWYKTGKGKPLVILHGWGSSSDVMMPVARQLQDIRTCCLIDFPGFGKSHEPPAAWGVDNYTDLVENFITKTFPDEKVDLLAHSYGARVTLKLLAKKSFASRLDKVVITGGAGLKPKRKPVYFLKKYTAKILKMPFYLLPQPLRSKGLDRLRKTGIWKKLGSSDYQKLSGVMRETFVKSVNEYLDSLLQDIQHELLLIWGENDTATPLEQGRRMEKGLKNGVLIVAENAGHYAFLDQPAHFAAIIKAYLEPEK
ncbi:MAG: alpha/beta hydrolase [Balneolaceae bacterium]